MHVVLSIFRLSVALGVTLAAMLAIAALFGFAVPALDMVNHLQLVLFVATMLGVGLVAISFGGSRWQRPMLIVGVVGYLCSGFAFLPEFISSFESRPVPAEGSRVLKVVTHNVFGLNGDMARLNAVITAEDPDIIALQEYFGGQARVLHPLLTDRYPYFVRCRGGKRANLGFYSKLKFDQAVGENDCPDNAYGKQRTAHIVGKFTLADGTSFSVLTSHLDWPLPAVRQQSEFAALAEVVNAIAGPLIVVGDFNSTPWSYALRGFGAATGLKRQTRNLVTYPLMFTVPERINSSGLIPLLPFLPLDHVFTRGISVSALAAGPPTGSDHLPVVFSFSLEP